MSNVRVARSTLHVVALGALMLLAAGPAFATISFSNNTLTYSSPGDLGTTVDPAGQKEVTNSYGITKASFQALSPQVVAFNGAPAASQTLRTLVAYYNASNTVTFTFPTAMYNYGSMTTLGRGSFSGSATRDAISTVPVQNGSLYDWFDATITTTGSQGVQSLGFCAAFRNDQAVSAGQVLFTLSDATTATVTLPALGGSGNPEYVFIGYTAPTGKTITRVQASRTSTPGGGYVSVDDLSIKMSPDTTAPAAVSSLASTGATASSVTLSWTAPGDDGSTGTATSYDVRYSTSAINDTNWASATQATGEPAPAAAGTAQNMTVNGLSGDTTYYFAMKTSDEVPNTSALSNVVNRKTSDTVAPAAVSNLAAGTPTTSSLTLTWTAPGDNGSTGTAASYDIRYRTGGAVNDTNWASATQVTGEPAPAAAGTNQNMVVSGLTAGTTYYFAIKTADEVPNTSAISNSPSGTTSAPPTGAIVALKRSSGLDTSGAIDSRFLTATVRTVTVSDAFIFAPGEAKWGNAGGIASEVNGNNILYKFDLSSIPTGSTVNLAQLRLYHTGGNSGGCGVGMVLTHNWTEGTGINWASYPGAAGGVSYAHPIGYNTGPYQNASGGGTAPTQSWGTTNDQFFNMATDVGTVQTPSSEPIGTGYHVINVTAHVQAWVNGTSPNYGWAQNVGNWVWILSEATSAQQPVLFVDYGAGGGGDTTAPAAVSNLATSNPTNSSITLTWTAPGDDGSTGTASSYDIRYRTGGVVNDSNWASATQVTGEPTPAAAGNGQSMVISGLSASTTYYFAIKTSDEVPNVSGISNSPSGTTTSGGGNNKPILGQSDFVYQGYYIVQRGAYDQMAELNYGQGFTHRYVSGQLRFLTFSFFGNVQGGGHHLIEFAPPAGGLGGTVTTRTNHWADIMGSTGLGLGNGVWAGLWFEQSQNRLWTTWAIDYPAAEHEAYTKSFVVRTLNSDGTVSNIQGPWGLQGIQQRRVYGGVTGVPAWFQSYYGCGPYSAGWGGYASRMGIGPVSLGPTCYTFPEPTGYPVGDIPTSAFKTLMDHSSATLGADWYPNGVPTTGDRGVRNTDVDNDYDTPYWQSPAPDGLGRWTWGDSNWNTGCWIETPNKQGFILVPKLCNGRTWYETSTLHCERQSAEIQVFDPNMLGQVAQGTRAAWNTYPTNRWEITSTCTPLGLMWGRSGNGPDGGPCGASYDATTQTLYIYCVNGTSRNSYILVYHVN